MARPVEPVPQVSDAGIGGKKPYTGNYPSVILDVLQRSHGVKGMTVDELGKAIGAIYDGHYEKQAVADVQEALSYLEAIGRVKWTGEVWIEKKVRV